MIYVVCFATHLGLFLILGSFDEVTLSEPAYWYRVIGCALVAVAFTAFYARMKEEK